METLERDDQELPHQERPSMLTEGRAIDNDTVQETYIHRSFLGKILPFRAFGFCTYLDRTIRHRFGDPAGQV
jgi:hypothetical protein